MGCQDPDDICTKCGYVQRELVCLLLPTFSVNNNNNTCNFIYISLSGDYLIWMSPEPKHAWDVHFTQSLAFLNNIHKTCFHFLKVYTKHAKHGLFTWYIWSIHIGLLYNHVLWVQILGFRKFFLNIIEKI
jgi:hypothetical protein